MLIPVGPAILSPANLLIAHVLTAQSFPPADLIPPRQTNPFLPHLFALVWTFERHFATLGSKQWRPVR